MNTQRLENILVGIRMIKDEVEMALEESSAMELKQGACQSFIEKDYQFIDHIVLEQNGKAVSPSWVTRKCLELGMWERRGKKSPVVLTATIHQSLIRTRNGS